MIDIAEARRLWGKTTQGEWSVDHDDGSFIEVPEGTIGRFDDSTIWENQGNAEFVAWSHNNTPAMLSEIERLQQRCSDLWDVLHDAAATIDSAGSNELYARVNHELDKGALGLTGTAGKG